MKFRYKFISCLFSVVLLSTVLVAPVFAHRVHRYHYRYHRAYRCHRRTHLRFYRLNKDDTKIYKHYIRTHRSQRNRYKENHKLHTNEVNQYNYNKLNKARLSDENQIRLDILTDINKARAANYLPPLSFSREDQQVAGLRVGQANYWYNVQKITDEYHVHGMASGWTANDDAKALGYNNPNFGENVAQIGFGMQYDGNQYTTQPPQDCETPQEVANHTVTGMMDYDAGSWLTTNDPDQWGHRQNILSDSNHIGIGVYLPMNYKGTYSLEDNTEGAVAEDFSFDY